ncbi:uncharacterized protein LOC100370569 [Saccoglossus kowalevskii]|uniref:Ubinuclein-2-like n=1 Tax=Saccoglossus kowalevskii TaxID=10224 RepID=A0ABM0MKH1_SACKO|nr:PREDICTED: ubinuclein-2-like [Saccoglossus kowalevskii]
MISAMAEPRRIIPTSAWEPPKKEKEKRTEPTLRFNVTLTESNPGTCPEFSYADLLKNALNKAINGKNNPDTVFMDCDEEDIEGLQAIARRFEAKYGPKTGKKKRKRDRIEDLIDASWGYDESDVFIDNSQAYDELVPAELTTKFGGFYINSGQLEFRPVSSSEDSDNDFQDPNKKKKAFKKKRKSSDGLEKERKRKNKDKDPFKKPRKQLMKNGTRIKKGTTPTVAELLQKQQSAKANSSDGDQELSEDMHRNIVNSINAVVQEAMAAATTSENNTTAGSDSDGNTNSENVEAVPKLPSGLSNQLESNIDKLKSAAMSADGKCRFFTPDVNRTLLQIESQARELSCGSRSSVYGHLASHLPCSKETLLKRAKKLRLNEQDRILKEPLQKLKEAVGQTMPEQLDRFQEECQQAAKNKYDKIMEDKMREDRLTSDEDEDKGGKRSIAPRKKFHWTDKIRQLLCDVVAIKVKTYEMSKTRSQSAEDYLKAFLEAEVKSFWPQGWIQTRMLFKESRAAHAPITLSIPKVSRPPGRPPKKVVTVVKKPGDATSDTSNPIPESNAFTILDYADNKSLNTNEESQESDDGAAKRFENLLSTATTTMNTTTHVNAGVFGIAGGIGLDSVKKEKPVPTLLKKEFACKKESSNPSVARKLTSPTFHQDSSFQAMFEKVIGGSSSFSSSAILSAAADSVSGGKTDVNREKISFMSSFSSKQNPQVRISPIPISTNHNREALMKALTTQATMKSPQEPSIPVPRYSPVNSHNVNTSAQSNSSQGEMKSASVRIPAKLISPSAASRTLFTTSSTCLVSSYSSAITNAVNSSIMTSAQQIKKSPITSIMPMIKKELKNNTVCMPMTMTTKTHSQVSPRHVYSMMEKQNNTYPGMQSVSTVKHSVPTAAVFSGNVTKPSKQTMASMKLSAASLKQTMPGMVQTVASMKRAMPSMIQTVSSAKQTMPSAKQTMPSAKQTMPTVKQTMPSAKHNVSTVKQTMSSTTRTVPNVKQTMANMLASRRSPPSSVAPNYNEGLVSRNLPPRLLQTSPVSQGSLPTTQSLQGLHSTSASGLLGGASVAMSPGANIAAGYQSITLVDLTRDPNGLPKHHPNFLSRDAIITGPAPGTYTHGQGSLFATSMHSCPPQQQLPPSLQSFQHQTYTEPHYGRDGTQNLPQYPDFSPQ